MGRGRADVVLSADLVALAVAASAKVYGDDPALALGPATGVYGQRRCLPAAAIGLAQVTGAQAARAAGLIGLSPHTMRAMAANRKGRFDEALAAVIAAVGVRWLDHLGAARMTGAGVEGPGRPAPAPAPAPRREREPGSVIAPEGGAGVAGFVAAVLSAPAPARRQNMAVDFRVSPAPRGLLSTRILVALAKGPSSPRRLAVALDAKEELVGREIAVLAHGKAIVAGPMPETGRRDQLWTRVGL